MQCNICLKSTTKEISNANTKAKRLQISFNFPEIRAITLNPDPSELIPPIWMEFWHNVTVQSRKTNVRSGLTLGKDCEKDEATKV